MGFSSRHESGGLDGRLNLQVKDDETVIVLNELARVALIKFIGKMSRDYLTSLGLTDEEVSSILQLYQTVQT